MKDKMVHQYQYISNMIVYHYTDPFNIDSILAHGLLKSKSNFWQERGGCIYLMDSMPLNKDDKAIFIINIKGLDINRLSDWELICWDDIEPERISLVQWKTEKIKCSECGKESISVHPVPMKYPCQCAYCSKMSCLISEG